MKTAIKNLKFGVLLIAIVLLSSCGHNMDVNSALGFNVINRTIPVIEKKFTQLPETRIGNYLRSTSNSDKGNRVNLKKAEKPAYCPKVKPILISVHRDARLV